MGKIISIVNQKGGVGKTTTAINLGAALAMFKQKVLIIDYDQQANATIGLGINREDILFDVSDFFTHIGLLRRAIVKTKIERLDLIASSIKLANIEESLYMIPDKEFLLKRKLDMIKNEYDFILIDCPPSLSMLTVNALSAADTVLVPIQCEYYALEGLTQLLHTINLVKSRLNPDLEMEGVVFTMYDARTNLSLQVVENVKDNLQERVYKTIIPRNVRLAEAPSHGLPINLYDARSTGAEAYHQLAEEVINRE